MRVGRVYDKDIKNRTRNRKNTLSGAWYLSTPDKGSRGEVGYNYMLLETYLHKWCECGVTTYYVRRRPFHTNIYYTCSFIGNIDKYLKPKYPHLTQVEGFLIHHPSKSAGFPIAILSLRLSSKY